jgi:hypothetical protein
LHFVAFDLLELAGQDIRVLPRAKRTELLRGVFPAGDRLVQPQPASRAVHDQLVGLGLSLGAQAAGLGVSLRKVSGGRWLVVQAAW